ncbi:MAG: tetratricopeptide repeat protein [Alphaproteobacteria bacterium]|nr:tetratricopeptide repeat protein [Alphaproteobacteria bacterium]MCB9796798.1 tetratricopeptide repeat protein [Alphaproteobacteria bacterium]
MRWTSSSGSTSTRGLLLLALLASGCITVAKQERAVARVQLGAAYLNEGSTESAIATLQEAVKLDRRNVDAWHQLALALVAKGANKEAEKAFKRALRLERDDAAINLNYAYLLQNLGRNEEAIERLEVARADLTYMKPSLVLNNLGFAYLQQGRLPEATQALEEAVIRKPDYCAAWYNLGLTYAEADEVAKGIDALDKVVMICPGVYPEATLMAGELLIEMGRQDEGEMYLSRVVKEHPGTPLSKRAKEMLAAGSAP